MPPKGSKRKPATPEPEPSPPPKKMATPRKDKASPKKANTTPTRKTSTAAAVFTALGHPQDVIAPVNVSFQGNAVEAKLVKDGNYNHILKLEASRAFSLLESIVLEDGPHEGSQAIIIKPAKAFPFLKLPPNVRNHVYEIYFAQKDVINEAIVFDGKRATTKDIYAKTYTEGLKDRVGLLRVNKLIYQEALPFLFAPGFRFESTTTLVDFISQIPSHRRLHIRGVEIKVYNKNTARTALHFLAEAKNITRLHIISGLHSGDLDPVKAAKVFMQDAYKFLEMLGTQRGDPASAVEMLSFGREAFINKDGEKKTPWPSTQVDKFREELCKKLQSLIPHDVYVPRRSTAEKLREAAEALKNADKIICPNFRVFN